MRERADERLDPLGAALPRLGEHLVMVREMRVPGFAEAALEARGDTQRGRAAYVR